MFSSNRRTIRRTTALFLFGSIVLIFLFSSHTQALSSTEKSSDLLSVVLKNSGESLTSIDAAPFEEMFQESLIAFESMNYIFLFNDNDDYLKAVIQKQQSDSSILGVLSSEEEAIKAFMAFVDRVAGGFFKRDLIEISSTQCGETGEYTYTIELREQLGERQYSGNSIAGMVTEEGHFLTFTARHSNSESEISKYEKGEKSMEDGLSEEEAIDLAYQAIVEHQEMLESQESITPAVYDVKQESFVTTDAGETLPLEKAGRVFEDYLILVNERDHHIVESWQEFNQGIRQWVIVIRNVETNRAWNVHFRIHLNAETGELLMLDHSR